MTGWYSNQPTLQRAAFQRADTSTGRNSFQRAESARWNRLDSTGLPGRVIGPNKSFQMNVIERF